MKEDKAHRDLKAGLVVTWIGMAVNVLLVVIKLLVGMASSSQALVADGVHSLSDLFSDIVVLLGLKWGRKGEDQEHPFGHARIETLSSMLVGVLLLAVGLGMACNAVLSIYQHTESSPGLPAIAAAAVSIALKEGMYRYTITVGRRIRSLALVGNAWHHRSDAMSSVAVLVGVTGAYLSPSWHMADACAALVVTLFIIRVAGGLIWKGVKELIDTAPGQKALSQLADTAMQVDGVRQTHDIRARYSGSQMFVEIHIVVDPHLTVLAGHDIASNVKHRLLNEVTDVTRVIVHVDPDTESQQP